MSAQIGLAVTDDWLEQERQRARREAFEEAALSVEAYRIRDNRDGPLLLIDVTRAIAKRVRALK